MENSIKTSTLVKMVLFTALGVFYYMVPFNFNGELTMCIAIVEKFITENFKALDLVIVYMMVAFALFTIFCSFINKNFLKNEYLKNLFEVKIVGTLFRVAGAITALLVYYKIGPEYIWHEDGGGFIISGLMPSLFVLTIFALVFISWLLDFGGVELLGGLLRPLFRPLFKMSGSGSVFSLLSWLGSGTTAMILTDKAHKEGELSTKEANIIVFGFAIISFPATLIYSTGIGGVKVAYFPYMVATLIVCTIVTSMILVRIPPISRKSTSYKKIDDVESKKEVSSHDIEDTKEVVESMHIDKDEKSGFAQTLKEAVKKVENAPTFFQMLKTGLLESFTFFVEVFPLIIFIATVALALESTTPIFSIISKPITPVLEFMGLPEAAKAAPSFVTGFIDLILPFLGSEGVTSQLTKFVICTVAIMQVFCMSEGGVVLLKSSLKISFLDLVIVFLVKTIISIPIAFYMGKMFGIG